MELWEYYSSSVCLLHLPPAPPPFIQRSSTYSRLASFPLSPSLCFVSPPPSPSLPLSATHPLKQSYPLSLSGSLCLSRSACEASLRGKTRLLCQVILTLALWLSVDPHHHPSHSVFFSFKSISVFLLVCRLYVSGTVTDFGDCSLNDGLACV